MNTQIVIGLVVNTLSFAYMGFTTESAGVLSIVPKILLNKYFDIANTIIYTLSFIIILTSPGNLLIKIGICLLMQFIVNHMFWGIVTGTIASKIVKRKINNLQHGK